MKVRCDLVTNSSSSSFIVRIGVRLNDGKELKYEAFAEDDGGGSDYGEVKADSDLFNKIADVKNVEELIDLLEKAVAYYVPDFSDDPAFSDHDICKVFDPKDFELYADVKDKSYTRDDYVEGCFYGGTDDEDDGRSVPYSKGVVIFDKEIRKKVKDLNDVKSIIVENVHTAFGECIDGEDFSDLDWDESSSAAESRSIKEMDLTTKEVKEDSNTGWL